MVSQNIRDQIRTKIAEAADLHVQKAMLETLLTHALDPIPIIPLRMIKNMSVATQDNGILAGRLRKYWLRWVEDHVKCEGLNIKDPAKVQDSGLEITDDDYLEFLSKGGPSRRLTWDIRNGVSFSPSGIRIQIYTAVPIT